MVEPLVMHTAMNKDDNDDSFHDIVRLKSKLDKHMAEAPDHIWQQLNTIMIILIQNFKVEIQTGQAHGLSPW